MYCYHIEFRWTSWPRRSINGNQKKKKNTLSLNQPGGAWTFMQVLDGFKGKHGPNETVILYPMKQFQALLRFHVQLAEISSSRTGQRIYNVKDTFLDSETSSVSPPHGIPDQKHVLASTLWRWCLWNIKTVYGDEELQSFYARRQTRGSADLQLSD